MASIQPVYAHRTVLPPSSQTLQQVSAKKNATSAQIVSPTTFLGPVSSIAPTLQIRSLVSTSSHTKTIAQKLASGSAPSSLRCMVTTPRTLA